MQNKQKRFFTTNSISARNLSGSKTLEKEKIMGSYEKATAILRKHLGKIQEDLKDMRRLNAEPMVDVLEHQEFALQEAIDLLMHAWHEEEMHEAAHYEWLNVQ